MDTTAANCVSYWYKLKAVERCPLAADNVTSAGDNESAWSSPIAAQATSSDLPEAVSSLTLDYTGIPSLSRCDNATNLCQAALTWPKVQQSQPPSLRWLLTPITSSAREESRRSSKRPWPGGNATDTSKSTAPLYRERWWATRIHAHRFSIPRARHIGQRELSIRIPRGSEELHNHDWERRL